MHLLFDLSLFGMVCSLIVLLMVWVKMMVELVWLVVRVSWSGLLIFFGCGMY